MIVGLITLVVVGVLVTLAVNSGFIDYGYYFKLKETSDYNDNDRW